MREKKPVLIGAIAKKTVDSIKDISKVLATDITFSCHKCQDTGMIETSKNVFRPCNCRKTDEEKKRKFF